MDWAAPTIGMDNNCKPIQPLLDSHSKQILLDCTNISYIDSMGIDAITEVVTFPLNSIENLDI